jgi:LPXTG-motif cell wall-anchored protein
MIRRVGVAATSSLAAGVIALVAAAPVVAHADSPVSGDPRATAHEGNATTCDQAGLLGSTVTVGFIIDPTNKFVTITSVPSNIELTGTVVKGGNNFNVYPPDARTLLHSPLVGNGDKNIPTISHWFACGIEKNTSSSSMPPSPSSSSSKPPSSSSSSSKPPTSSSSSTSSGSATTTTTTTPAAQGSSGTGLASTGFSATAPLVAGGALLLIGGGLLYLLRRTRKHRG